MALLVATVLKTTKLIEGGHRSL